MKPGVGGGALPDLGVKPGLGGTDPGLQGSDPGGGGATQARGLQSGLRNPAPSQPGLKVGPNPRRRLLTWPSRVGGTQLDIFGRAGDGRRPSRASHVIKFIVDLNEDNHLSPATCVKRLTRVI